MNSIKVLSLAAACLSLVPVLPVSAIAAPDAARVYGDIRVDGIVFNLDGSNMQTKASPWSFGSGYDIFYIAKDGRVGINTPSPLFTLDVAGTVNAALFQGSGSGLTGVALSSHNHDSTYWRTTGNASTTPGTDFVGTTDNTALEFKVNNSRAIRIEPNNTSPNIMSGYSGNVAGGVSVYGATVSGGGEALFANTANGNFSTVGGGRKNTAGAEYSTIGGGDGNSASGAYNTVGGGTSNVANSHHSTISGGDSNTAGAYGTVGGGYFNRADQLNSTVSGGDGNTAGGILSAVGGGSNNIASGPYSTVGGGQTNTASGWFSWAGGRQAKTHSADELQNYYGAFIWADSNNNSAGVGKDFYSAANDEFAVRARGGVRLVTAVNGTTGVPTKTFQIDPSGNVSVSGNITSIGNVTINPPATLNFGSTTRQMINLWGTSYGLGIQDNMSYFRSGGNFSWYQNGIHNSTTGNAGGGLTLMSLSSTELRVNGTFVSASDRNKKENFAEVDSRQILEKVANLQIQEWNYRDDDNKTRHIGPMAQDFHVAFNIGPDDKHIATVDADGIALAAIKALKTENDALKTRLERLERLLNLQ